MSISLDSSIRTCKVDTGYSNKFQSDRFLNPSLMVCPTWNGVDITGRQVCPDSFWTKNAGCNSAEDRVMVENSVGRPQYMEYINLSANGIDGSIYGNTMPWNELGQKTKELNSANNITGNFGLQFGANTSSDCGYYPYEQTQTKSNSRNIIENFQCSDSYFDIYDNSQSYAQHKQNLRQQQALQQGFITYDYKTYSGNRG